MQFQAARFGWWQEMQADVLWLKWEPTSKSASSLSQDQGTQTIWASHSFYHAPAEDEEDS